MIIDEAFLSRDLNNSLEILLIADGIRKLLCCRGINQNVHSFRWIQFLSVLLICLKRLRKTIVIAGFPNDYCNIGHESTFARINAYKLYQIIWNIYLYTTISSSESYIWIISWFSTIVSITKSILSSHIHISSQLIHNVNRRLQLIRAQWIFLNNGCVFRYIIKLSTVVSI